MGHVTPKVPVSVSTYKQPPTETTARYQASHNEMFLAACAETEATNTPRQYRKYIKMRGLAAGRSKAGKRMDKNGTEVQ